MTHREPMPGQSVPRHIRTRRNLWLSSNPSYFDQPGHALSLPLAYDRLVRVYQSPAERQAEGQRQGWAKMLESALVRGEAKRDQAVKDRQQARLKEEVQNSGSGQKNGNSSGRTGLKPLPEELDELAEADGNGTNVKDLDNGLNAGGAGSVESMASSRWDVPLGIVPADELIESSPDRVPDDDHVDGENASPGSSAVIDGLSRAHAQGRWHELLRARFVAGDDEDASYSEVDTEAGHDKAWQESQRQNEWFEDETEHWSDDGTERGKKLEGETGIQDF